MLFISANLAVRYPEHIYRLFIGVFLGAYMSDLIAYYLGRRFGPELLKFGLFKKTLKPKRILMVQKYYKKYGVITLILGRFIPFGVRNALFMTAGFSKMSLLRFSLSDFLACTISISAFFTLYYKLGPKVIQYVKQFNIIIFASFLVIVLFLVAKHYRNKRTLKNC